MELEDQDAEYLKGDLSVEDLRTTLYLVIPTEHMASVAQIIFSNVRIEHELPNPRRWNPGELGTWPVARLGQWDLQTRKITIFDADEHRHFIQLLWTILHELGHAICDSIDETDCGTFRGLHSSYTRETITLEARQGPDQDFAECYASYILRPEELSQKCPHKYAFFLEKIFDNRWYSGREILDEEVADE